MTEPTIFITQNAMMCPDGTYLVSSHVHDYRDHQGTNGDYCAVDGGYDYIKRVGYFKQCEELSTFSDTPFLEAREKLVWGSYGKSGKEPLRYVRLKDMENEHIKAVIAILSSNRLLTKVGDWRISMMLQELEYRKQRLLED